MPQNLVRIVNASLMDGTYKLRSARGNVREPSPQTPAQIITKCVASCRANLTRKPQKARVRAPSSTYTPLCGCHPEQTWERAVEQKAPPAVDAALFHF